MKVVCIEEPRFVRLKDVEAPKPKPGEALVKVKAVGICGSDVAAYRYKHPNCNYPLIIGHETAGLIEEIGNNEQGLKRGDRVILDPYLYCGDCYPCAVGRTNCCENLKVLGVQTDGSMGEYFAHPTSLLVKVPDHIPWAEVPLAEPLTIALHAIHQVRPQQGEHFTVMGSGPIGLMAALAAQIYGAISIVVDVEEGRLKTARNFGIKHTINGAREDVEASIRELTNGRMSETVMEASGAEKGIANSLRCAAYTGRIAFTGWPKQDPVLPTSLITKKELKIMGSRNSANEFEEALELIATKKINMEGFISEIVSLEGLPEAVRQLDQNPGKYLKIVGLL
jgi:2-desacetyl-2-hydroxyethyl bacteriochlorophyllide A dehydrogenase